MKHLSDQLCAALRAHLAGGRARPPEAGVLLWNTFLRLSAQRTHGAHGPNPIAFTEIEAFCRLSRLPLEPRHVEIVTALDAAWLEHAYGPRAAPEGVKTLPPASKQPLTAALFDAMMR